MSFVVLRLRNEIRIYASALVRGQALKMTQSMKLENSPNTEKHNSPNKSADCREDMDYLNLGLSYLRA